MKRNRQDSEAKSLSGSEDNAQSPLVQTTNPLGIPCILEMVWSFLPLDDLKESRQVCRVWKQEIDRFVRKLKSVRILGEDYSDAASLFQSQQPYTFQIMSQLHCKGSCTSSNMFEKLIIFKGGLLHQLTLEKCHLNVDSFINVILSQALPYLSLFTLRQNTYVNREGRQTIFVSNPDEQPIMKTLSSLEIDERGMGSQSTLRNIAIMCPNLKRLTFSNCPVPVSQRKTKSKANFQHLEFLQLAPMDGRKMDFQYFEALTDLKLNSLKTLFLYGMTPGGKKRMKVLKSFLKSVSLSLISLHLGQRILYSPEYKSQAECPFPVSLPNLKRLSVGPGFFHNLKFLDNLESVNSFTCNRIQAEDWTMVINRGIPKPSNSILSLDLGDCGHVALKALSPGFPNLVRLELNVTRVDNHDSVLRAIFDGFPNLQIFNIYDVSNQNLLTDSGLIGIESTVCDSMARTRRKRSKPPKREHSYIGNLEKLIDLRLQYLSANLTDLCVLYGIKDLRHLFALDLSKSSITDTSLMSIGENLLNLSVLYIRDCSNISQNGIEVFMKKFPHCLLRM